VHGLCGSPEYRAFQSIVDRCTNPKCHAYAGYGGRGISICDRWRKSPQAFLSDVRPRPSALHSIDRIDNNGNYEPGNVRWATKAEQVRNRNVTSILTFEGRTASVAEWAELTGINYNTVMSRLRLGWSAVSALTVPPLDTGRRMWRAAA
jgi:hypothetical protein